VKRLLTAVVLGAALLFPASAAAADLVESSTWRESWTNLTFPVSAQDTAQQMTRYVQLPATVAAGDIVIVNGREEFSNPSWDSLGAWTVLQDGGARVTSEHWTTPIMGACGMKRLVTPGDPATGSWISQQVAENFDGIQHHWVYDASEAYRATAADAGAYVAIQCYFSRSISYRDVDADYVQSHQTYGRIEAVTLP
jgi:hypothetical protein